MSKFECYRNLAGAVLLKAVEDQRKARKILSRENITEQLKARAEKEIEENKEFAESEWCGTLAQIANVDYDKVKEELLK